MRILQIVTYLAFIIGAAGIEEQEHNMQPAAVILMFAAAAALLIMAKRDR